MFEPNAGKARRGREGSEDDVAAEAAGANADSAPAKTARGKKKKPEEA
jgi:hypothetical protein